MGNPAFIREAQQPYFQEDPMKKYLIAAALIGAFVTPALSQAGEWYVGFDTATKKCSVVSSMPSGMKMMGKYTIQGRSRDGHARHEGMQGLGKKGADRSRRPKIKQKADQLAYIFLRADVLRSIPSAASFLAIRRVLRGRHVSCKCGHGEAERENQSQCGKKRFMSSAPTVTRRKKNASSKTTVPAFG